jgi:hypothetical protein
MFHYSRVVGRVRKALNTVNCKILSNAAAAFNGKFEKEEQ